MAFAVDVCPIAGLCPMVVVDQSALQAIETLATKYEAQGKTLQLRHLSRDCHRLLNRAGQLMIDSDDDPDYGLAVHYGVRTGILGAAPLARGGVDKALWRATPRRLCLLPTNQRRIASRPRGECLQALVMPD